MLSEYFLREHEAYSDNAQKEDKTTGMDENGVLLNSCENRMICRKKGET